MPSLTPRRDLRSGRSPWLLRRVALPPRQTLRRDRHCDVLVVGAGISGALMADALSAAGLHVILCERRPPLTGSTMASTALVQYEIDMPLSQLRRRLGRQAAERLWRRSRLAVDALRERARRLGIAAELTDRESLYLQGNLLNARGLQREAQARRAAGFDTEYLSAAQVEREYGLRGRAALHSGGGFTANPRALAAGLLRAAISRGAELFAPAEVVEVQSRRAAVHALMNGGRRIVSRHLVFATGYEVPRQVPVRGHRIISTWAIGTVRQPRLPWPGQGMIWEASSPYLYLRTMREGHVLCGGADEDFSDAGVRDAQLPAKTRWLQRRLGSLLPHLDTRIEFAWTGSFGASADGLPTIGAVPGLRNCYAVLGFGGNGTTYSMLAAQMLRNLLCGDGDADLELVGFRGT